MVGNITVGISQFPGKGETLICPVFENEQKKDPRILLLDKKLNGIIAKKIEKFAFEGKEDQVLIIEPQGLYEYIVLAGAGKSIEFSAASFKKFISSAVKKIQPFKTKTIFLFYEKDLRIEPYEFGKQSALGFYEGQYRFDKFKGEEERKKLHAIQELHIYTEQHSEEIKKGILFGTIIAEGIYLTRNLVNEPSSHVHPETLVQRAFDIEKQSKGTIDVQLLEKDECKKLGMGAFLAVAQGSGKEPKFIVLHYKSKKKTDKNIAIIGKSITFDSGGLSLKPAQSMEDMKIDMAGGATVLGLFSILARLPADISLNKEIYGILPACENMPSGTAMKPGDVVTALNGKTIEVLNTDAEGRMALADALSYAELHLKSDVIIDLATLTGACMVALGTDIAAMLGNDRSLLDSFAKTAKKEGEELWELPLYKPYLKLIKSDIADLSNISKNRYGGTITAALFLSEFIKKSKWVHLDIAGSSYNKGATGWGVIMLLSFLLSLSL